MNLNINPDIAEILGAFIGDGWIESRGGSLYIIGHPTEDKEYYDCYLAPLFSKCFTHVKPKLFPYWSVYGFACYKSEFIKKAISLGFQTGYKAPYTQIPSNFLNSKNKEVVKSVLRGIFDTDGCFWCERSRASTSIAWKRTHNYHPEIGISSCSKRLLEQMRFLLSSLNIQSKIRVKNLSGFSHNRNVSTSYSLNIRRIEDIKRFFDVVGTSNPKHRTKYEVWKKIGYLPPHTTIKDRKIILKN